MKCDQKCEFEVAKLRRITNKEEEGRIGREAGINRVNWPKQDVGIKREGPGLQTQQETEMSELSALSAVGCGWVRN